LREVSCLLRCSTAVLRALNLANSWGSSSSLVFWSIQKIRSMKVRGRLVSCDDRKMPLPLRERPLDILFILYFIIHIPVTVLYDAQAIVPRQHFPKLFVHPFSLSPH